MQPDIVEPFTNASMELAQPPPDVSDCLKKNPIKFCELESRYAPEEDRTIEEVCERRMEMQMFLLALKTKQHLIGQYSNWHTLAQYIYGYDHPSTLTMAHL